MIWTDELNKQYRVVFFISVALYILVPLVFLLIPAFMPKTEIVTGGQVDMLFYILLIVGLVEPLAYYVIEKVQVKMYVDGKSKLAVSAGGNMFSKKQRQGTPMGLFTSLSIIKASLVEAIFVYGLVNYFLSHDIMRMLYFYPIGILWTLVHFPRKSQFEKLVEKVGEDGVS